MRFESLKDKAYSDEFRKEVVRRLVRAKAVRIEGRERSGEVFIEDFIEIRRKCVT